MFKENLAVFENSENRLEIVLSTFSLLVVKCLLESLLQ